uniref:Ig-like domain-containing protein n=1 Tax=Strongyloides stercoralis TaxID=6248 RepID=A0A913I9R6_STRER
MPFQKPLGERIGNHEAPHFIRPLIDRRVIVGQKVHLDCEIKGHPCPVIKWLKDGQNVTNCPDYELSQDGDHFRLLIKSAQFPDCGRFTVQAMNAAGIKQSTCMLIVAPAPTPVPGATISISNSPAPPQTPVGSCAPIFLKEPQHQPLKIGNSAVIEARIVGNPQPQIYWYKDDKPLNNYRIKTDYDSTTGICLLTIPQMFEEDVGKYTCKAVNNISEVSISVNILPKELYEKWFKDEQLEVTKERKQRLMAQIQPKKGPSTPIRQQLLQKQHQMTQSPLLYSDNDGTNGIISESEPELDFSNTLSQSTIPIIKTHLRGLRLTEGTDAILQCNIIGNPKPIVNWFRNNQHINPNESARIQISYKGSLAMLKISMVTLEDNGNYTVLADNVKGQAQSSARIEVYPLNVPSPTILNEQPQRQQRNFYSVENYNRRLYNQPVNGESVQHQRNYSSEELLNNLEYQDKEQQYFYSQSPKLINKGNYPLETSKHFDNSIQESQSVNNSNYLEKYSQGISYQDTTVYNSINNQPYQQPINNTPFYQQNKHQAYFSPSQYLEETKHLIQKQQNPPNTNYSNNFYSQPHLSYYTNNSYKRNSPILSNNISNSFTRPISPYYSINNNSINDYNTNFNNMAPGLNVHNIKNKSSSPAPFITNSAPMAKRYDTPHFTDKFSSITVSDGDYLKLNCKATGNVTEFRWFRDGAPLNENDNIKITNNADGESVLEIMKAKLSDGGWYQCDAINAYGSTSIKGRIVVQTRFKLENSQAQRERIQLRKVPGRGIQKNATENVVVSKEPPKIDISSSNFNLKEGQSVVFDCKVTPADDPNLKIAWLHNGKPISASSRITNVFEFGHAILEISSLLPSDSGEYTVIAVNPKGEFKAIIKLDITSFRSPSVTSNNQSLNIGGGTQYGAVSPSISNASYGGDKPNFHSELRSQELFVGQNINFEVKLTPFNDPTMAVEWYFNGNKITPSSNITQAFSGGFAILNIKNVDQKNSGVYTCRATNEFGTAETSGTIIIHEKNPILEYDNNFDVEDIREMTYSNSIKSQAPKFLTPLKDCECLQELGRSYFEARYEPVNDNTLRIVWLKDGRPIQNANRIQYKFNFGIASLTIHPTYPEDAGTYTCVLHNVHGQTQSQATLRTHTIEPLQLDSRHQESLAQIGYLDAYQVHIGPIPVERPEEIQSLEAPKFVRPLGGKIDANENDPVHFEARIIPPSDVKMKVDWFFNDKPLPAAHRYKTMFDFGYVALDILYVYPEDSGIYKCVASNELGSVESSIELNVTKKNSLFLEAQHPEGLEKIKELEAPKERKLYEIPDGECEGPPTLLGEIEDGQKIDKNEHENIIVFYKLSPINDPTSKIEWTHNGIPLLAANRIKMTNELGIVGLSMSELISEDSGEYIVKVKNQQGECSKKFFINVNPDVAIKTDTHHEESLPKIEYIENLNKYAKEEIADIIINDAPVFIQPLPSDIGEIEEGLPLHMEAKIEPVNDNSLKIVWLKDDKPLPSAHRYRTFHDFGFVSLDILHVYSYDSGTYTCLAVNKNGEARSSTKFFVQPKNSIISTTHHPTSVEKIAELEAPKPVLPDAPEPEKQPPQFVKPLSTVEGESLTASEGDNVYLEAQIIPTDDNSITYEWYLNDKPLKNGHRFVISHDFGFVALNILYIYPEDSGTYTLVVRNPAGEAKSSIDIQCNSGEHMLTDTFHPTSIARIAALEAPRPEPLEREEEEKVCPQITASLPSSFDNIKESQTLHLEVQCLPVNDNTLKVEWFHNGHPLCASNRTRLTQDFGYVALDIGYMRPEDSGEYKVVISNDLGKAESVTKINVESLESLIFDTSHPESLRRIQEIEALKPAKAEQIEVTPEPPVFTQQLQGPTESVKENQSVHMDCMIQPINDPKLKIEWYHNGNPLKFSSRIRMIHDFGYVALEFLNVLTEDSGRYTCRAINDVGEAITEFDLNCVGRRNIYLDTQHQESWNKIQEIENRKPVREPTPDLTFHPPIFTQQLENIDNLIEGDRTRLICRLQPINDPTLKVYWTRDGNPLPSGNRFLPARNIDLVTLDIMTIYGEDSGNYVCKAISDWGEAETSCVVQCQATDALLLNTQHETSWNKIQEIEARRPDEPLYEEPIIVPPRFINQLSSVKNTYDEGEPIHIEGMIEPINDNKLKVEWYFNGAPLSNGHRFRPTHDFGYVALDILYAFPSDSGTYTCVARNHLGEAKSDISFNIGSNNVLFLDPQHPQSWEKIKELEAPKPDKPEEAEVIYEAPKFIQNMENIERYEGQPVHFETRVTPINDPKLTIQWHKDGYPLGDSNRFVHANVFGFVALDILHTKLVDIGEYTVVAKNDNGEASTKVLLNILSRDSVITSTEHEASWAKIQQLEAPKQKEDDSADVSYGPPKFVTQLNSINNLIEGQPAHLEATYQPISDPNLKLQWYHNGRPLAYTNRMSMKNDFGLCTLDIHYVFPQDIGDYKVIIINNEGQDTTEGRLDIEKRLPNIHDVPFNEASWVRIQEIEAPKPLPEPQAPIVYQKPSFTQPLQSISGLPEGQSAFFECNVIPANDPNLQIQWFFNDTPLKQSNRYTMSNDFGYVTLRIQPVYTHDAGVYSCKAINNEGNAITTASLEILGDDVLHLNPLHPESLLKIQQLEAIDKNPTLELPVQEYGKPVWLKTFENVELEKDEEGQIIQLHGVVEPANDPNLKIEWFLNGIPLHNANRFRSEKDFGYVTLTILHVLPHDSGVYTCTATNLQGSATTSSTVKVAGYEAIMRDTQHPVSWERIQELERPIIPEEIEIIEEKEKPRFVTPLEDFNDIPEGTPIRLEASFTPARDNDLQIEWECNGKPIQASQLLFIRKELGWSCLDINGVNPDHNGVYTLKIKNTEGDAACSCSVKVLGVGSILGNTTHEASWKRIQEIEAPKEKSPSPPPEEFDPPVITTQLTDVECDEGDGVSFYANYTPTNDPTLQIEWIRNGAPLRHGNKYYMQKDFGVCQLEIGYAFPEDEGVYSLRVFNKNGEAVTTATLKCHPKDALLLDTHHEASWQRIQEIEAPKPPMEEMPPPPKVQPKFTSPLKVISDLVEGQPAHFETTVEPVDDPDMVIEWYLNNAPFPNSSRCKMINDFGWVILNINSTDNRDSGEWTCVARNSVGEAKISASLNVTGKESILKDSLQPNSLARIEEIEAPKLKEEERPALVYDAPVIVCNLQPQDNLQEGDGAHLVAEYTPIEDPNLRVEWLKDGHLLPHSNRHKMINDFGFAVLDILYLLAHDSGEYTLRVYNNSGEAKTSVKLDIEAKSGLILNPQDENKAKAVQIIEDLRNKKPEVIEEVKEDKVPIFIEPLTAPISCSQGDSVHFNCRYEPNDDNKLQVQWYLNGKPLKIGSRVKTINDFGFAVLEINPVYPEDSGEYTCRAFNKAGEAVTSTTLTCDNKENIIRHSQLPERMAGAQEKINEIENRKRVEIEEPEIEHGPPKFVTPLVSPQDTLKEGDSLLLETNVTPVADPNLQIEWFHNGIPIRNTARMRCLNDFGHVILNITPAEPQDNGVWLCKARNRYGEAEISTEINVEGDSGVVTQSTAPGARQEKINELEEYIHRPKPELEEPVIDYGPPKFIEPLPGDLGTFNEADTTTLMCVLEPVGDPTMKIEWFHNGHNIPYSNRIHLMNDFGVVSLIFGHLISLDSGEYKIVATNSKGSAETTTKINVESPIEIEAPQIVQALVPSIDANESEAIHFEARITPINDPTLKIEWFKDGKPLVNANRHQIVSEFGFVTLDILYAYPEDSGEYELKVTNAKGEASTKSKISVTGSENIIYAPQATNFSIANLERHLRQHTDAPLELKEEDAFDHSLQKAPEFKTKLNNIGCEEGDFARFECQIAPINDPYMKVEWYKNKQPVLIGNRLRNTLDFGYAALDLLYTLPDDTGEYHCVATNKYGQSMISGHLACSGKRAIITDRQLPQGFNVKQVTKNQENLYFNEDGQQGPKENSPPQFTIQPRTIQVTEFEPARFECAVVGYPKPKITWYVNGQQALHGLRYKLNYDGIHYLVINSTKISDAGEIVAIAKNPLGEVLASCNLDVFQRNDFRQHKLKNATLKSNQEIEEQRNIWQKEALGKLGEAFDKAPKADPKKLLIVEKSKCPFEQLESDELISKFTKTKNDEFYDKLSYIEAQKQQFEGMKLEDVKLKPGQVNKFESKQEELPKVNLKNVKKAPADDDKQNKFKSTKPEWTDGWSGLGKKDVESKFKRVPTPPPEVDVPARDQVKLKTAKPKRASELPENTPIVIDETKAKLASVKQKAPIVKEKIIPHKDQVPLKTKYQPNLVKENEHVVVESKDLKQIDVKEKEAFEKVTVPNKSTLTYQAYREQKTFIDSPNHISVESETYDVASVQRTEYIYSPRSREKTIGFTMSRPQPTKLTQSQKSPPTFTQQLKPIQGEVAKSAQFSCEFEGDQPITVVWLHNNRELKPSFETQIRTVGKKSTLELGKLKESHAGEYACRLSNVAGKCESSASLSLIAPIERGIAPNFTKGMSDVRVPQNSTTTFSCEISGKPIPTITWFKDGKQLPNDNRYKQLLENNVAKLVLDKVLPVDSGVYECVLKNVSGEARCKARLNCILTKTGKGQEAGPRLEAPKFTTQIQPIVSAENQAAEFRATFTGSPEPSVRWFRNNEPIKPGRSYEIGNSDNEAWLKFVSVHQDDVAEYKCEAVNPAGKATTVANLVLKPKYGKIAAVTRNSGKIIEEKGSTVKVEGKQEVGKAPTFTNTLQPINARQGQNAKFVAEFTGTPPPTVTWCHNNKQIDDGQLNYKITTTDTSSTLEITKVNFGNSGIYTCIIRNPSGASSAETKLNLQMISSNKFTNNH